jgi:hypothetical protein
MTKKHFEALAAALKAERPMRQLVTFDQWKKDCVVIANTCQDFNPNFDRARFLAACGVEG